MKVYVYKENGMYDCESYNNIELFQTEEKALQYFKEKVDQEILSISNHNYYVSTDWETVQDGEFLITDNTDHCFSGYVYGCGNEYSVSLEIVEMECK